MLSINSNEAGDYLFGADVASDSMQLLAGAWRSRRNAHIVFLPIKDINSYLVQARSGGWEVSFEVSMQQFWILGKNTINYGRSH